MLAAQYPVAGNHKQRPKSGRKPLQPKNVPANPIEDGGWKAKPKRACIDILLIGDSNKENHPNHAAPMKIEPFDASLAEELSAVRKKIERLRLDKERTEKMLRERDLVLEMQMRELERRGEEQKQLEMEVDRLYRLNQLKSSSMTISPLRSLREKQRGKKFEEAQSQDLQVDDEEESMDESTLQSPSSESSELVAEK